MSLTAGRVNRNAGAKINVMAENIPNVPGGAVPPKKETGKVQPKKETVRINLPPKPSAAPTIKLPTLPPGGPAGGSPGAPAPVAAAHAAHAAPAAPCRRGAGGRFTPVARRRRPASGRRTHCRRLGQHAGQSPRDCRGHCRLGRRRQHSLYSPVGIAPRLIAGSTFFRADATTRRRNSEQQRTHWLWQLPILSH